MGRPVKNNADYFPHFTTLRNHRKVKVLRNKFGSVLGYAFWCMMIEWLTEKDGLEWEYSDVECEMFAAELGVSATEIRDMVDFCIKLELLFKTESGFVYSESLNDNLKGVFDKRQIERAKSKTRKRREDGTFATNNTTNGRVSAAEKPQSKVKHSKEDKDSAGAPVLELDLGVVPTPPKKGTQASEKPKDTGWKNWTEGYYKFLQRQLNKEKPVISDADFKGLRELRKRLHAENGDDGSALKEFLYILHNWSKLENYYQNRIKANQINSELPNIQLQIRKATTKVTDTNKIINEGTIKTGHMAGMTAL
jgi:hypothetical protein